MAVIPGFSRTINYISSLLTSNLHTIADAVEGLLTIGGAAPVAATGAVDASASVYGGTYTNDGAVGASPVSMGAATVGRKFTGIVMAAQSLSLVASGTDVIRNGGDVGGAAGSVSSNVVGNRITLECFKTGLWTVGNQTGDWNLT